ncbi:MAG TPA: hypothetical protein VGG32_10640 [Thermoplasmata archaeon]|jgi:hypothetical protein
MDPRWIASTAILLTGLGMLLVGHFYGVSEYLVFGVIVLVLGIVLSAAFAGLTDWRALIILTFGLLIFFTLADVYNLFGLSGWV